MFFHDQLTRNVIDLKDVEFGKGNPIDQFN